MRITKDRVEGTLDLSQEKYIDNILSRFNFYDAKPIKSHLASHLKLTKKQSPKKNKDQKHIKKVPYVLAIRILIYIMIYIRPNMQWEL